MTQKRLDERSHPAVTIRCVSYAFHLQNRTQLARFLPAQKSKDLFPPLLERGPSGTTLRLSHLPEENPWGIPCCCVENDHPTRAANKREKGEVAHPQKSHPIHSFGVWQKRRVHRRAQGLSSHAVETTFRLYNTF